MFDIGDQIRLFAEFTDFDGNLANPTLVECKVLKPDGSTVSVSPVNSSVGVYYANFTPTLSGVHWYRWTSTGVVDVSEEDRFSVRNRMVN